MGLLENKSWQAQDAYNEYLSLKKEIMELTHELNICARFGNKEKAQTLKDTLKPKVERMKVIFGDLRIIYGIAIEDLLLLSMGVEV